MDEKPQPHYGRWLVGIFIGLPLLAGAYSWATDGWDSGRGGDFGEGEARVMCEEFVSDRLKSPGSADFNRPTIVLWEDPATFRVSGSVDSENSFGATKRIDYQCTVRGEDGTATLVDLTHQER